MHLDLVSIAALGALLIPTMAVPSNDLGKRAFSFPIPASKGSVTYSKAQTITGTFDGGLKTYGRGVSCTGDAEGGDADAVFILANGATLKNAIIGKDQIEGVHCLSSCTIQNVWWTDVCEDALSVKGNGNVLVSGGGAREASDKVVQHNGFGTVTIDGFSLQNFGKLYRSCGNCSGNGKARSVIIKNVKSSNGKVLAGINSNYGDTATISSTCANSVKQICTEYKGNNSGDEPPEVSTGPSNYCKYSSVAAC